MYKCRGYDCEIHKNGHYSHWPCGKYDPIERYKAFQRKKNPCKCGQLKSFYAKVCRKCSYKIIAQLRIGVKLSEEWKRHISESQRGSKGNNWKGGVTPINKLLRSGAKFKNWRNEVFKRDNWTCQECKRRGGELHPDHIKPFAEFPELRFDVDNGRTLCKECHQKKHYKNLTTHRIRSFICARCGNTFKPKSRATWRNGAKNHFCSLQCRGRFYGPYFSKLYLGKPLKKASLKNWTHA